MLMHESLTTSSLLTLLKQESPLEVSTCGGPQNAIKGTPWHPFDTIESWYEMTNEFGPFHTLDRAKQHHHRSTITQEIPPSHQQHHHTIHPAHELSNRVGFTTTSTTTRTKPTGPRPNGYLV
jgi:hypothetical protein